jgi:hypothetical protein
VAIGDNLPGIFGNLVQSVMKSGGDPQYIMDLTQGLDADREQGLRLETMMGSNIPPFEDASSFDLHLQMTGDPIMAADMALQDTLSSHTMDNDMSAITADIGAQTLFNFSPGTIDNSLFGPYSQSLGIDSNDLATAYNDINEGVNAQLSADSRESIFEAIPQPHGGVPPEENDPSSPWEKSPIGRIFNTLTNPRQSVLNEREAQNRINYPSQYQTPPSPEVLAIMNEMQGITTDTISEIGTIPETVTPTPMTTTTGTIPTVDFTAEADFRTDLPAPLTGSDAEGEEIKRLWDMGEIGPNEVENRLEAWIVAGMDKEAQAKFNQGEAFTVRQVNDQVNTWRQQWGDPSEVSDVNLETTIVSQAGAPDSTTAAPVLGPSSQTPSQTIDYFNPSEAFGFPLASSMVPPPPQTQQPLTIGESQGIPMYQGITPSSAFQAYGAANVPGYYDTSTLAASLGRQYRPLLGAHMLQQIGTPMGAPIEGQTFGAFLEDVKPETYTPLDWDQLAPSWNKVVQGVTSSASAGGVDPDAAESIFAGNQVLSGILRGTASDKKRDSISLALSRYHAGKPVVSSYANRAVASSLEDIYDRTKNETDRTGGDTMVAFLNKLITLNPERFG